MPQPPRSSGASERRMPASSSSDSIPQCRSNSALGSLNRVKSIVRSLNFVVCVPEFHEVNRVSSGATDLFRDVFGEEAGLGGRATIGVTSLARSNCFENWLTVEVDADGQ